MKMSTSSAPKVPNSTPISARPALRAPIHNPYDKFSQPEFDAWIGDLTSVLKRALGHEPPSPQPAKPKPSASFADISVAFDEDVAEDSFAEIKARRAAKGKQRAVRDEDEEEFEVETSIVGEHIAEEEDILQDLGYSPHRYDSQPEEGSEDEEAAPVLFNNADEPIEILSSDEDEGEYDDDQVDAANVDSGRFVEDGREYEDIEDEGDGILRHMQGEEDELDDELNAEEEEDGPDSPPAELSNARYSTRRSAEDDDDDNSEMPYNARSRAGKVDETEDEEDIEEIEDEEFAPTHPVRQLPAVELLDKWEGPRVYAEDFYAGGDQPQKYMSTHTPSHLTPPPGSPKGLDDLGHTSDAPTSVGKSNCVIGSPEVTEVDDEDEDGEEIYEAPPTFSMPTEEEVRAMSRSGLFDELQNGATVSVDADEPVDFTSDLQQSIAGRAQSDELVSPAVHTPERPPSARQFVPHDRSLSPIRVSPRGHLDWNNPPAFPTGIPISPSKSPRPRYNNVLLMDDVVEITDEYDEDDRGEEAQDDDEQDDDFVGPAPLGTSDLDIFTNHDEVLPDAQELLSSPVAHLPESVIEDFDVFSADDSFENILRTQPDSAYPEIEVMYAPTEGLDASKTFSETRLGTFDKERLEPLTAPGTGFGDLPGNGIDQDELNFFEVHMNGVQDSAQGPQRAAAPLGDDSSIQMTSKVEERNVDRIIQEVPAEGLSSTSEEPLEGQNVTDSVDAVEITNQVIDYVVVSKSSVEEVAAEGLREEMTDDPPDGQSASGQDTLQSAETAAKTVVEQTDVDPTADVWNVAFGSTDHESDTSPPLAPDLIGADGTAKSLDVEQLAGTDSPTEVAKFAVGEVSTPALDQDLHADQTRRSNVKDSSEPITAHRVLIHDYVNSQQFSPQIDLQAQSEAMLQPGVPMPVSADPNVPDPASVHTSPTDSPKPVEEEEEGAGTAGPDISIASAIRPSLLKQLSGHRTVSGLFTPMSELSSSPPSPSYQDGTDDLAINVPEPVAGTSAAGSAQLATSESDGPHEANVQFSPPVVGEAHEDATTLHGVDSDAQDASVTPAIYPEALAPVSSDQPIELVSLSPPTDADADADGEDDEDYELTAKIRPKIGSTHSSQSPERYVELVSRPLLAIPEIQINGAASPDEATESDLPKQQVSQSAETAATTDIPAQLVSQAMVSSDSGLPPSPVAESENTVLPRSKKRKRAPPALTLRLTRSRSSRSEQEQQDLPDVAAGKSTKSKGKQRAHEVDTLTGGSSPPEHPDGVKSAGEVARNGSRASSVASSAISELSVPTMLSPTLQLPPLQHTASLPLMHAHGVAHNHGPAIHQHRPIAVSPSPPVPPAAPTQSEDSRPSPQPSEPAMERIVQRNVHPSMPSSSPVTRSNCRFHKISIPQEGKDTKLHFAVPGCSLNHELMREEEIQDHGVATNDDQILPDVESLGLDPYVLSLLRQLVGVDLLREQEVFFLPQTGDRYRRPKKSLKSRLSAVDTISGRMTNSSAPRKKGNVLKLGTSSSAGSRSASVARSDRMSTRSTATSVSDNDMSEGESRTKAKRAKRAPSKVPSVASSSGAAVDEPPKRPTRRSRRLQTDAFAYKPSVESDGDSSDDEVGRRTARDGNNRQGTKRRRAADDARGDTAEDDVSKKKRRVAKSLSADLEQSKGEDK